MKSPLTLACAALAVIVFGAAQAAWMRAPCGTSLDAEIATGYTLYSCRSAAAVPWSVHRGQWSLVGHERGASFVPYTHHPPLGLWIMQAFHALNPSMVALRCGALLLTLACVVLLWMQSRAVADVQAAWAVALFAGCAAVVAFGSGASPPLFGMPFMLAALWIWNRKGAGAAYFFVAFLAGLADWNAFGVLPALWASCSLRPGFVRRSIAAALPWVAALAALTLHSLAAREAGADPVTDLIAVLDSLGLAGRSLTALCAGLAEHCVNLYGWPLLLLAMGGSLMAFVRTVRRQDGAGEALLLQCWVMALVPCLVFLSRSATHPFWVLLFAPAIALSGARVLSWLTERGRAGPAAAALLSLAITIDGTLTAAALHAERSAPVQEERARLMETLIAPDELLLFSDYSSAFAARALTSRCVIVRMESHEMLTLAARAVRRGAWRRVFLAVPESDAPRMAWLWRLPGLARRDTVRKLEWPASQPLLLLELDPARFLALAS